VAPGAGEHEPTALALHTLGRFLLDAGYRFVTVTPATHERVEARDGSPVARTLRDLFGWNRPLTSGLVPPSLVALLGDAQLWVETARGPRSAVRAATVDNRLYFHTSFPTDAPDAVFFGPDTYRFVRFLRAVLPTAERLVDLGAGSGAGGLEALATGRVGRLVLTDINARALAFSRSNAALQVGGPDRAEVEYAHGSLLDAVDGSFDAVVANPPFLVDEAARAYRNGGGDRGIDLSVRMVEVALRRLVAHGTLVLYSATPIVEGKDLLLRALRPLLAASGRRWDYDEIDPDIFPEELTRTAYRDVERIAAVGLVVRGR
jgi:SAM-dependent methyltransferase